jgi:hypothetical protein
MSKFISSDKVKSSSKCLKSFSNKRKGLLSEFAESGEKIFKNVNLDEFNTILENNFLPYCTFNRVAKRKDNIKSKSIINNKKIKLNAYKDDMLKNITKIPVYELNPVYINFKNLHLTREALKHKDTKSFYHFFNLTVLRNKFVLHSVHIQDFNIKFNDRIINIFFDENNKQNENDFLNITEEIRTWFKKKNEEDSKISFETKQKDYLKNLKFTKPWSNKKFLEEKAKKYMDKNVNAQTKKYEDLNNSIFDFGDLDFEDLEKFDN